MEYENRDESRASRIKEAAKKLFIDKGYDGTTMQAIADSSAVNKALLHYYFQSKDKLFLLIFREELAELSDFLATIWQESGKSLRERLEDWIDSQTAFLARVPRLPLFIITEMTRNPELIKELLAEFLPPPHLL
jgi:TetR/AcrR family transcriptional regulator